MSEPTIACPACGHKFALTDAVTHDIEERLRGQFAREAARQRAELEAAAAAKARELAEQLAVRDRLLEAERTARSAALAAKDKEFTTRLAEEKARLAQAAEQQARAAAAVELQDLKAAVAEKERRLAEAQKQELELRKARRELEDRHKEMELELQRKVDEQLARARAEAEQRLAEQHRLRDAEKEMQLADLRRQIEDLQRRAEQGSQQGQGEVLELALEEQLARAFDGDLIEPVPKGVRGADVLQRVGGRSGPAVGTIMWESKRTKAWSDGWVAKLKDDQRQARADVAVIVTTVLPEGVRHFAERDGVWVAAPALAIPLGLVLRERLIEVARAHRAQEGRGQKMEMLYHYLSGQQFRQRVEGIVEAFVTLRGDLETERRAMEKIWSKREKQLERVLKSTAGMYGDLQGIAGAALPNIQQLELPEPEA